MEKSDGERMNIYSIGELRHHLIQEYERGNPCPYMIFSEDGHELVYVLEKHGRWLVDDGCSYCSVCRNNFKKAIMNHAKYCPMCGAKMDGERREDESD